MSDRKWKSVYLIVFITFLLLCWLVFLKPATETKSRSVLSQFSKEEQADLQTLCEYLIKDTEFGYTLFGTKPVTMFTIEKGPFCDKNRQLFVRLRPILTKLFHHIKLKKYALTLSPDEDVIEIFFVNQEICNNILVENKHLFEKYGVLKDIPLKTMSLGSNMTEFLKQVCHENTVLSGICLGYGIQNALNFARMQELRDYFRHQETPPWKCRKVPLSKELNECHLNGNQSFEAKTPYEKMNSSCFFSLEEEIEHLQKALQLSSNWLPEDISSIQLPQFLCDPTSNETAVLLKKYKEEQKQLRAVLYSNNIVEQVLDKLTQE